MTEQRLRPQNVIGVFDDVAGAWGAVQRLVDAGFDVKDELSVLGPMHEMRPAADELTRRRGGAMSGLGAGVAGGAATGAVGGAALVGLASTAAAIPGVGLAVGTAVLYGLATGATGGGVVGGLLGLEAAGRRATMWQQTLSPLVERVHEDDVALTGVHVDDRIRAEKAREILEELTDEVQVLNADIDYQPPLAEANLGDRVPSGSAEAPGEKSPGLVPPGSGEGEEP
jgi:hypothetical protein